MGLKQIVKNLQKALKADRDRASQKVKAVQDLVEKLEKKEAKFRDKLASAKTEKETKKAKRHIKVCKAQLEKGKTALKELKD